MTCGCSYIGIQQDKELLLCILCAKDLHWNGLWGQCPVPCSCLCGKWLKKTKTPFSFFTLCRLLWNVGTIFRQKIMDYDPLLGPRVSGSWADLNVEIWPNLAWVQPFLEGASWVSITRFPTSRVDSVPSLKSQVGKSENTNVTKRKA